MVAPRSGDIEDTIETAAPSARVRAAVTGEGAMRRIRDGDGRPWDVVLGRESWGALYALFVPATGPVRQTLLEAESYGAAQAELEALTEEEVLALLSRSEPKDDA